MTLLELLVSQTVVLFVVAGVFALVTAMLKSFHTADGAAQAQVRLREVGHVLLRDLVALGGADGRAGELLQVVDEIDGPDSFSVFKVNPGLCGGGVSVVEADGVNLEFPSPCPFSAASTTCRPDMLEGRTVVIVSERASFLARLSDVEDGAACKAKVSPSDPANVAALERLRRELPGTDLSSMSKALDVLVPGSLRLGSRFQYRVSSERLERAVDGGAFSPVVDGVYDLQIARAYDIDNDGTISSSEWLGKSAALREEEDLPGASARTYFGAEVAIVTFGRAADDVKSAPPSGILNRAPHQATDDEKRRRYRAAKLFMAARNRTGGGP